MKTLPLVVFMFLVASAVLTSLGSAQLKAMSIEDDVETALSQTLAERQSNVVDADTIRVYRSYISIPEVRDTASISVKTVYRNHQDVAVLEAKAGCSFLTVFALSDQRPAGALVVLAILWAIGCCWYKKRHPEVNFVAAKSDDHIAFGGLSFIPENKTFLTDEGTEVRLTPMQQQLMEMFFRSPSHSLSKQDICNTLWPKKPDASDTLYTLIRRIKPILEGHSHLKIESDRGRAYVLTDR
ncbi:MAG: helix-turn-helix domain-containing protein [Bacteroidaceae bacterium]|nr:helix-turn-helix domain-containing protein [Bacteroidaceae bacterium]